MLSSKSVASRLCVFARVCVGVSLSCPVPDTVPDEPFPDPAEAADSAIHWRPRIFRRRLKKHKIVFVTYQILLAVLD